MHATQHRYHRTHPDVLRQVRAFRTEEASHLTFDLTHAQANMDRVTVRSKFLTITDGVQVQVHIIAHELVAIIG